jgi:2-polyprenyl-3-methyl-5-hydroxy-6-metoxy-1,4-benzoquinol methylase
VDIARDELKKLKKKGYNVKYADAESMELGRQFDVVFAGELLEHLSNPGMFLAKANSHLKENGLLVLTTPNAFSLQVFLRNILGMKLYINEEHVCFYELNTLRHLLDRYGFKIEDIYWHVRPGTTRIMFLFRLRRDLVPTIILTARKIEDLE